MANTVRDTVPFPVKTPPGVGHPDNPASSPPGAPDPNP